MTAEAERDDAPTIEVVSGAEAQLPPIPDAGPSADGSPLSYAAPGDGLAAGGPASGIIPPAAMVPAVKGAYGFIAERRGEFWRVSDADAQMIAEPLAGELSDLLADAPFLGDALGALGGRRQQLLVALGVVTTPRLLRDVAESGARRAAEQRAAMQPATPAPRPPLHAVPSSADSDFDRLRAAAQRVDE